jgi:hypothetical protein
VLAIVDALHFAHGYQPMGSASKAIPPRTASIDYLQRHVGDGRVVGTSSTFTNDWTAVYGLRDVRGHDAPQPSLRFFRLWQVANGFQAPWQSLTVDVLESPAVKVLAVLGVRYIATDPTVKAPPRSAGPGALAVAYHGRDATILANREAAPRALVAPSVHLVTAETDVVDAISAPGFDPRREVVVERDQPGAAALSGSSGSVHVASAQTASVSLAASLTRPGLVMLDDVLAPGWTVKVDGHRAQALRVDDVMRGVAVPAGTHRIEWSYSVPGLKLGAAISGLALIALLGWSGVLLVRRRGRAVPDHPS